MSTLKYYDQQSGTWKFLTTGERGPVGPTGAGVPDGGTTGQVIRKNSNVNQDTSWSTLNKSDVGLANVDNTSDASKPVSTATQTALNLKANLASPTFTGTVSGITKTMVGLGNVDNTTDLLKPISTATQNALNLKEDKSNKGIANGYASLGADAKLLPAQLPALALVDTYVVASQAAMLALTAEQGDVAIRTDLNKTFILSNNTPTVLANWKEMLSPTDLVSSVNGRVGAVTGLAENSDLLAHTSNTSNPHNTTKSQVGLANVDNTSDVNKPISTATQTALNGKVNSTSTASIVYRNDATGAAGAVPYSSSADEYSMAFRTAGGVMSVGTPTANTHATTKLYVDNAISGLNIGNYVLKAGDTMSGNLFVQSTGTLTPATSSTYALRARNSGSTEVAISANGTAGYIQSFGSVPLYINNAGNNVAFGPNQGTGMSLGLLTTAPTHTLTLSTTASGIALYNTTDQTTNYERVVHSWVGSVYNIAMQSGGSGAARIVQLSTVNSTFFLRINNTSPLGMVSTGGSSGVADGSGLYVQPSLTASAGTQYGVRVSPTVNQSTTAAYTALEIATTETTTGSGTKLIIDGRTNGTSRFSVDNTGYVNANRYYVNSTAYFSGAVAGRINFTGDLAGGTLILNDPAAGITSGSASGLVRVFGGPIADGAGIVMGGSTHASIPDKGELRVGSTSVASWTTNGFRPESNMAYDLGTSGLLWNNLYARTLNLNTTASIHGNTGGTITVVGNFTTNGNVGFGSAMPTVTSTYRPTPSYRNTIATTNRGYFTAIAALAGQPDLLYNADRNPKFTITSTVGTGILNLFNGGITGGTNIPVANLATTPWVLTIESSASIAVSDVSNLMFLTHRLQSWGETFTDYKVETKSTDNNWYTAVEYTGVSHSVSNLVIPLHNTNNAYPGGQSYHAIRGIRITVSGATASSHVAGNVQLAQIQFREFRPSVSPAVGLGAVDTRGGQIWGDLAVSSNTGNVPLTVERQSAFNSAILTKNSVNGVYTGVSSTGRYTIATAFDLNASAVVSVDTTNNRLGIRTVDPTHAITLGSTATGFADYTTADQVTNYERFRAFWNGTTYTLQTEAAGTGSGRSISLGTPATNLIIRHGTGNTTLNPNYDFNRASSFSGAGAVLASMSVPLATTSGTNAILNLSSSVSQSGTAGYSILLVNATENTTGSGNKYLIQAQTGGSDRFTVTSAGTVSVAGRVDSTLTSGNGFQQTRVKAIQWGVNSTGQFNVYNATDTSSMMDINPDGSGFSIGSWGAGVRVLKGTTRPNNNVSAPVGSVYFDTAVNDGNSAWVKKSGTGNTGWTVMEGNGTRQIASTTSQSTNYFEVCRTGAIVASSWLMLVVDVFNTYGVTNYYDMQYARYKISIRTDSSNTPTDIVATKVYGDSVVADVFTAVANADATISLWARSATLAYRSSGITAAYAMNNSGSTLGVFTPLTSQSAAPTGVVTTTLV